MGTNYYADRVLCPKCGQTKRVHIGKSSHGWKFTFATHEEMKLGTIRDWLRFIGEVDTDGNLVYTIYDEYGGIIERWQFFHMIIYKQDGVHRDSKTGDGHTLDSWGFSFASEGEWC